MKSTLPKESRTSAEFDLLLELAAAKGRRSALELALRDAIRAGRLRAGTRLPSSRVLARELGMARSTVSATPTRSSSLPDISRRSREPVRGSRRTPRQDRSKSSRSLRPQTPGSICDRIFRT
jgi:DNA-binding transcriptional MocR family regulator